MKIRSLTLLGTQQHFCELKFIHFTKDSHTYMATLMGSSVGKTCRCHLEVKIITALQIIWPLQSQIYSFSPKSPKAFLFLPAIQSVYLCHKNNLKGSQGLRHHASSAHSTEEDRRVRPRTAPKHSCTTSEQFSIIKQPLTRLHCAKLAHLIFTIIYTHLIFTIIQLNDTISLILPIKNRGLKNLSYSQRNKARIQTQF